MRKMVKMKAALSASLYHDAVFSEFAQAFQGKAHLGQIGESEGAKSYLSLNLGSLSTKLGKNQDPKLLNGRTSLLTRNYGLGLSQGLGLGKTIELGLSGTLSDTQKARSYLLGYSQWFWDDALQLSLSLSRQIAQLEARDFTDTDGRRILTLDKMEVSSAANAGLLYINPKALSKLIYASVYRKSRPPAWLVQVISNSISTKLGLLSTSRFFTMRMLVRSA